MKTKLLIIVAFTFIKSVSSQIKIVTEGLKPSVYTTSNGVTHYVGTKKMEIQGSYNGKNLFVKNPFGRGGIGFCIHQINVNGNITTDEINAEVFKIDLELHLLKIGDKIKLDIWYTDSCYAPGMPMIMNPGAIKLNDASGNNSLVIEGKNWNASLLVTNPRSHDGKSYGIKSVTVNGQKVDGIGADVFEINFLKMGIKFEEKLKIEFKYENTRDPMILNPEVINW